MDFTGFFDFLLDNWVIGIYIGAFVYAIGRWLYSVLMEILDLTINRKIVNELYVKEYLINFDSIEKRYESLKMSFESENAKNSNILSTQQNKDKKLVHPYVFFQKN